MSGYPGAPPSGYPGAPPSGYPGAPPSGYPGAPPAGYPGAPPQSGGYPGGAPPPAGYPGAPGGGYQQQQPGGGYPGARPAYGGGGGYGGPPGGGYPGSQPSVDPQVAQWFNAVDTDRSGQIDAKELQRALVNGNWTNFSEEACRMMIDMFDANRTGTIDIRGFSELFSYINNWKREFEKLDKDRSGLIDQTEYTQALEQMGYRFSPTFISNLLAKYDPRGRRLKLDDFIVSNVQIKRLTDSFRSRDTERRGAATLQYEDFIGIAMGAHK